MTIIGTVPDVTSAAVTWVKGALSERVSSRIPKNRPPNHVVIRRTGGSPDGVIDNPVLLIEAYSRTGEIGAFDLANRARDRLQQIPLKTVNGVHFYGAKCSAPIDYSPPDEPHSRAQFTAVLRVRMIGT